MIDEITKELDKMPWRSAAKSVFVDSGTTIADLYIKHVSHLLALTEWVSIDTPPKEAGRYLVYTKENKVDIYSYNEMTAPWWENDDLIKFWKPITAPEGS